MVLWAFFGFCGGVFVDPASSHAGEADVVGVEARKTSDATYRFSVTVAHADTGWDHYADAWQVIGPDGVVLGERILAHPHVNEQPFTRSLSGVAIPNGITSVIVRARDLVHGFGGQEIAINLPEQVGEVTTAP
ncbi:MAG TPA: hypothetical protein DEF21_00065 [Thalassospira lucentensis]|uniref:Uncharacterized protein n=1 Tax=Thalassospira lucentensis TaxID=168935 RepID=A0A358HNE4_9PROT|nr:hypothetical protein [Thalassospira lucentensis]HCW66955.1 hypothetical protein [Thalassospira lucentensis]